MKNLLLIAVTLVATSLSVSAFADHHAPKEILEACKEHKADKKAMDACIAEKTKEHAATKEAAPAKK
ncbi:MAG: hypothetical protein K2Q18_14435 [Bdellovibrionales bacterium]|nr:hypothetical protein [Bdellovibrionales bacterium]